jgi:hypothetical protein
MAKALLLVAWLVPTSLWLLAMTRWRRDILRRQPPGSAAWYWLRVFRIPETERNRTRLLVGASAAGILMVTFGIVLAVVLGKV